MPEFDHGIKKIAHTTGRQIARVAGIQCAEWGPLESTLQITTELLADRAFLARQGRERFVIYFEFYTTWDPDTPWDMLAKSGLLSQRQKLPTVCIAVVLRDKGFRSRNGQLRLEAAGGPTQHLWFREVCLWRVVPKKWWEDEPGLMALYPLCHHGQQPREAIRHAAMAIERQVPAESEQKDFLTLLGVFGQLHYPRLDVMGIIGREKMKESKLYQEILEEGRQEGSRASRRNYILGALHARFGAAPSARIVAAVNAIEEVDVLDALFQVAMKCSGLNEFRAALPHQEITA